MKSRLCVQHLKRLIFMFRSRFWFGEHGDDTSEVVNSVMTTPAAVAPTRPPIRLIDALETVAPPPPAHSPLISAAPEVEPPNTAEEVAGKVSAHPGYIISDDMSCTGPAMQVSAEIDLPLLRARAKLQSPMKGGSRRHVECRGGNVL